MSIDATYSNGECNITFEVEVPNGDSYLVESVESNETGFATLEFTSYRDDPAGNWTIHASTSWKVDLTAFSSSRN